MTEKVNIHEAKTHLSKYLAMVQEGREIVIAKSGKPIAKLIPIAEKSPRVPGSAKGRITVSADFNEPLPEHIQREFEG